MTKPVRQANGFWKVASKSNPQSFHLVRDEYGFLQCDCKAATLGHKTNCSHVRQVVTEMEAAAFMEATVKAQLAENRAEKEQPIMLHPPVVEQPKEQIITRKVKRNGEDTIIASRVTEQWYGRIQIS